MKYFTLFFVFFSTLTFSQSNFIKGSITTNNNQVIEGLINYQDWRKTPEIIEFKKGDVIRNISPKDILEFEVEGDKFVSKLVTLDVTEQRLQKMNNSTQVKFEDRQIFLNVLVLGKLSLYEFSGIKNHFFYKKNDEVKELTYRRYFADNNVELITNKIYIGQLNVLFDDCNNLNISNGLEYKRKQLTEIFSMYNSCGSEPEQMSYKKEYAKKVNSFYISVGYYLSNFNLESNRIIYEGFEGGSLSTPSFGVAYEIGISKGLQKWSLFNELAYKTYSETYKNKSVLTSSVIYDSFVLKLSTISLSTLVRYKIYKEDKKIIPFINIGFGYNYIISDDSFISETLLFQIRELPVELRSGYFDFNAGFGLMYDDFLIELRYNITDKFLTNSNIDNSISNIGLLASYKLFN